MLLAPVPPLHLEYQVPLASQQVFDRGVSWKQLLGQECTLKVRYLALNELIKSGVAGVK